VLYALIVRGWISDREFETFQKERQHVLISRVAIQRRKKVKGLGPLFSRVLKIHGFRPSIFSPLFLAIHRPQAMLFIGLRQKSRDFSFGTFLSCFLSVFCFKSIPGPGFSAWSNGYNTGVLQKG
jgi:hypothetical protein